MESAENDTLPTAQEKETIQRLRKELDQEIQCRRRSNLEHDCLFGDVALARVLRGNDNDFGMSVKWLKRCVEKVRTSNLDTMIKDMSTALDKSATSTPLDSMLPHHAECKDFVRALFSAPEHTPRGDLVNYISFAHFDMWAIMSELEWSHWVKYMQGATILRMLECERESRKQKRMVRVITIMDVGGLYLSKLNCPPFHWKHNRDLASFQESIAAEIFGPVYILNAPSMVQSLIRTVIRMIPKRFAKKVRLVEGDGTDNPEFIKLVGGLGQLKQMLALREAMFTDGVRIRPLSATRGIARGEAFVHSVDVQPGDRLSWEFHVKPGFDSLGESDLRFSAWAFHTDDGAAADYHRHVAERLNGKKKDDFKEWLVKEKRIRVSDGKIHGGYTAARPGVIWLRWSNLHSKCRGKVLRFKVTTEVVEEERKPEQLAQKNGSPKSKAKEPVAPPGALIPQNGSRSRQAPAEKGPQPAWACCTARS